MSNRILALEGDDPPAHCFDNRLNGRCHAKPLSDRARVLLDGDFGDPEDLAHLPGCLAVRQPGENFGLAGRKRALSGAGAPTVSMAAPANVAIVTNWTRSRSDKLQSRAGEAKDATDCQ